MRVNLKEAGDCFGELSLLYTTPRSATVAATLDSVVWVLERDTFRWVDFAFTSLIRSCNTFFQVVQWGLHCYGADVYGITCRRHVKEVQENKTSQIEVFLNSVPLLSYLSREEKLKLASGLEEHTFKPKEVVVNEVIALPHSPMLLQA